ncbi:MAG: hypothetical protein V9E94_14710 [Microthrixaceae bacterium]
MPRSGSTVTDGVFVPAGAHADGIAPARESDDTPWFLQDGSGGGDGGGGDGDGGGGRGDVGGAWDRVSGLPRAVKAVLWAVGAVLLWVVLNAFLPSGAPLGVVLSGAIIGSATGLTAVGLILIWRANRVINFANGAMAGVAGLTAVHLFVTWDWPYWATFVVAPLLGLLVGALVEMVVIRRFANAPRLVLTVATIGLAQLLGGIEMLLPTRVFDASMVLGAFETPLNTRRVRRRPRSHQRQPPADPRRGAGRRHRPRLVPQAVSSPERRYVPRRRTPIGHACWASRSAT